MSKKSGRRPKQPKNDPPPQADLTVEHLEAKATAAGLALPSLTEVPKVAISTVTDVSTLRSRLYALIEAYTHGKADVDEHELRLLTREGELNAESSRLKEARAAIEEERSLLDQRSKAIESEGQQLQVRAAKLNEREEKILAREADADAGFVTRREKILRKLQQAHDALLERNRQLYEKAAEREQAHLEHLAQQQTEHERKLEDLRGETESSLQARVAGLREAEEGIGARERELKRALFDAHEAERDAKDLKAHIEEHIEEKTTERVANTNRKLEAVRRDSEALRSRISKLEKMLSEREAAVRTLENMSPEAVKMRIDTLQGRIGELENELADRPSKAEAEELRGLREQRAIWEQERQTLLTEKGRIESGLGRLQIEVDSVEILRDRNTALLQNQRLLKAAIDDLRTDIDERLDKHRDQPVFPEMLRMDDDPELKQGPSRLFPGSEQIDLREFAEDLRQRIGLDLNGERPELYYREEDVRAFLGGLAMSRLHIVQGISGIGKSSLPRAFADAVGGFCETVSVQAGWRDRNDLFGYFNAFERRYYELPFTQAIYKAQTPQWRDRVAIILLDEMNLSHPEQYAADVLDVLERQETSKRRFELVSFTPPGKTPVLVAEGRFLPLPENLWFVGTANHDETTKDFADKTYDRSFVLELPERPKTVPLEKRPRRAPVSYQALTEAFDRATAAHEKVAEKVLAWMDQHLRDPMAERFRVGWGGRLESQIRRFIPVVVAAGGSLGEALDQLITNRVLRKIKGRHDNIEEDLDLLSSVLGKTWPDKTHEPSEARKLIADELRYRRG